MNRQRTDLEETFGEPLDDDEDDSNERGHLLGTASASSSSSSTAIPAQPPTHRQQHHQPAILPVTNDGVFANMSAKPEREADKQDETPPVSSNDGYSPWILIQYRDNRHTKMPQLTPHLHIGKRLLLHLLVWMI